MLLSNGSAIKNDVIESFATAVNNPENMNADYSINWNFVDADMNLDLGGVYDADYLYECFEALADKFETV